MMNKIINKRMKLALTALCLGVTSAFADGVTVSSSEGAITVTVGAGAVEASSAVYLVWDETDKGETFSAWANSAKLGDVTAAGDTFTTNGLDLAISDGAKIRVFVGTAVEKFASITAPVGAYALLDYHSNAKTELSAEFTILTKSSGSNYNIMGGIQNNGGTPRVNYSIALDNMLTKFSLWTYLQASQPVSGGPTPAGCDLVVGGNDALLNQRGTLWMKGADVSWTPQGGTAKSGTTQAPVYENTQKFGVWCRSQGSDTSPDSNPLIFNHGTIAFHKIKMSEDGTLVRDYIPSKQNDVPGFYDLVTGEFAVKAGGSGNLTLGDSLGMVMGAGATASSAATYSEGDTPEPPEPPVGPTVVTVTPDANQSKTEGAADPVLTYTLSANIAVTGALSRAEGETVGTYAINLGTLGAADPTAYTLELAAGTVNFEIKAAEPEPPPVPPEPPTGGVGVSSSAGSITVTVAAGTVEESTPVYLVWDVTDKGETFAAWANSAKLGDVTSAGDTFPTTGAAHAIPNGAKIRVFVGATVEKFASITAPAGAYALLDYHTNAKTELFAEFTPLDYSSKPNTSFLGCLQSNGSYPRVNYTIGLYSGRIDLWTYLQRDSPQPGTLTPVAGSVTVPDMTQRGVLWTKGKEASWTPNGGTAILGATQAPVYENTQKFGVWCRSMGSDTNPDSSPAAYACGTIAFHEIKFLEEGVLVRDYIPSKQGDVAGFYDLVTGEFAAKAGGSSGDLTLGESLGVEMRVGAIASAQGLYDSGDPISRVVAQVADVSAKTFDGTIPQLTVTVSNPSSADAYQEFWDWNDGLGYAHKASSRYSLPGTYTNSVMVVAAGYLDYFGTGIVTIAEGPAPSTAYVDFVHAGGVMKPVNGVCGVPKYDWLKTWGCFPVLSEAGVPIMRLHDVCLPSYVGGSGIFVDIPNLFPVFSNDVESASSYRFGFTDHLIKSLYDGNNIQPIFRLGVSREDFVSHGYPAFHTVAPQDALKWAKICEQVILHYTQGQNGGFLYKIPYWEIWGGADDHPVAASNEMWSASFDAYKAFYGTVATYLKDKFPNLKFGGYMMSDVAALSRGDTSELATYRRTCAENFLAAARDNGWPLDFFSYRITGDVAGVGADIAAVDALLTDYGFTRDKTERFCAEWLPSPTAAKKGTALQAAEIAAGLALLQAGPCDMACLYAASNDTGKYAPLFRPFSAEPRLAINSFKAFRELRAFSSFMPVRNLPVGVYAAAAGDDRTLKLMVVNLSGAPWAPAIFYSPWKISSVLAVVNGAQAWVETPLPDELPDSSVWLITLTIED